MTDEEVQQIYDYLHKYWNYEDGELKRKSTGRCMGWIKISENRKEEKYNDLYMGHTLSKITINKVSYIKKIQYFIYIYHYKTFPDYLRHIDGNRQNNKIENLAIVDAKKINEKRSSPINNISFVKKLNKYRASIGVGVSKDYHIGYFSTEKEAVEAKQDVHNKFYKLDWNKKQIEDYCEKNYRYKSLFYKNVYAKGNKFYFQFLDKGKRIYQNGFVSPEEAHAAYLKAKEEYKNS